MSRPVALVAGCSGTLGMHVTRGLAEAGCLVIGLDIVTPAAGLDGFIEGDVADPATVEAADAAASALGELKYVVSLVSDSPAGEPDDTPGIVGPERLSEAVAARLEPAWMLMALLEQELSGVPGDRCFVIRTTDPVYAAGPAEAAASGAVDALVRHASGTLSEIGIRVCAVALPDADAASWAEPAADVITALAVELTGVTGAIVPVSLS